MYLIAIAWMYVVLMMAVAEATAPQGSVLGAVFTFVLYGVLPLSILMYILGTPGRRRALRAAQASPDPAPGEEAPGEAAGAHGPAATGSAAAAPLDPDGRGHAAGDPVAPIRKEP